MERFQYPMEVFTAQNKHQTFSVTSNLAVAKIDDTKPQSPLKIYHDKFALYKFAILEPEKAPKAITTNINVKELEAIFRRTDYAFNKHLENEYADAEPVATQENTGVGSSPAYTVRLRTGMFKGKTPAEVLLANPENKEALKEEYKALRKNMDRFPLNKEQMDAIFDAATLYNDGKLKPASADMEKKAYTVQIKSGTFKGKTPAEVLIANPKDRDGLKKQYEWLKSNLAKYPANKEQMDAIDMATRLLDEGKLSGAEAVSPKTKGIKIYPAGADSVPKPLERTKREDGRSPIRETEIWWHVGNKYPVEIVLKECWTIVQKADNDQLKWSRQEAVDKSQKVFHLSEQDWLNCIRAIKTDMNNFEMLHAKETRTEAENYARESRRLSMEKENRAS